ncbi:MAG: hypothetical protein ACTSRS_18990 [Candidatus Helarchaeota archaeon]
MGCSVGDFTPKIEEAKEYVSIERSALERFIILACQKCVREHCGGCFVAYHKKMLGETA